MYSPTPPRDPRHQRFADRYLSGDSLVDAYMAAGFKCARTSAMNHACRLRARPDVVAYIAAIQRAAAEATMLTVREKRRFLARVVRTSIFLIDPGNAQDPNGDLIKSFTINEGELSSSRKVEKLDPLKAIELDNKLSGDDAESNSLSELAAAIASISYSPIPTDRM